MNPWPVDAEIEEVTLPRPGHADLAGMQKFGHTDLRNVLERATARETAARVAAGAVAKGFLSAVGVEIRSHVLQIGSVEAPSPRSSALEDFEGVDESPVRALDDAVGDQMVEEVNRLRKANESLGGTFEVRAFGLVPGPRLARLLGREARRTPRPGRRLDPGDQGRHDRRGVGCRGAPGLGGPRRDLLRRRARLLPRDQQRRRSRGRDDQRRAARRAGGDEADLDPDQAPAIGRHRDQGAESGAEERTDSAVVPAAAVVGEAMVALTVGARIPREVRR